MSAINVNSITGRTGAHGPVLTGVTTVSGDLDVTGKVSVAGTVSYEDVTSVDSVGIITAQAGIRVTGGDLYSTSAGGRIGVGTNTGLRQLEVFSATHATAAIKGNTQSSLFLVDSDDSNIGQISYIHADNYMYFRVNDAERLRITSAGQVLIGTDSTITDGNFGIGNLQVTDKTGFQHVLISGHSAAASNATCLSVGRSRGSQSSPGYLSSGDHIARFSATSYNGGNYQSSGAIDFFAADQHASNDLPGYITFKTVPDGSTTLTERVRITSAGDVNNLGNVGVQTSYPTSSTLVGAASSLIGLYIGDGHLLFSDNLSRSGGYYIPSGLNALNAGPVTLGSTMTLDGVWVIV